MAELLPLAGYRVGVTADRLQAEQVELLRRRGADVLVAPTVRTVPLVDDERLREAIDELIARPPEVLVALTGIGMRSLLAAADSMGRGDGLRAALAHTSILARGPKAAGAIAAVGLEVAWRATSERTSEVAERLEPAARKGARIAVQRDGDAVATLADLLSGQGADAIDVPVYRWQLPEDTGPARRLVQALRAGAVDAVTFTSSPAVRNLLAIAAEAGDPEAVAVGFRAGILPVFVGPVCAETAVRAGLVPGVVPERARMGSMIQALGEAFAGREQRIELRGGQLVVQGAAVSGTGVEVRLSGRERDVLRMLAEADGAVVSKARLLQEAWPDESADEHVVEVTVARLRRRLGAHGDAIQTVSRRGYRLRVVVGPQI